MESTSNSDKDRTSTTSDRPAANLFRDQEDQSWTIAKVFARVAGRPPSLFSSCIRGINKVESILQDIDSESVREFTIGSGEFLVKVSPTLKSVLYHAAQEYYPDKLASLPALTTKRLISIFEPREIASIIGLTYLYKQAAKNCNEKDWDVLSRKIKVQMAIGATLGTCMQNVGRGSGLLLGAIRFIAIAAFATKEPGKYQLFRKQSLKPGEIFDMPLETKIFGCNHLQIASHIVQELGFCMPRSPASMSLGMDALNIVPEALPSKLREHLLSWRAAMAYIESYHGKGEPPTTDLNYALVLPIEEAVALKADIKEIVKKGGASWIDKTKKDLPEQAAIALDVNSQISGSPRARSTENEDPLN